MTSTRMFDLSVAEIISRWPTTTRIFIDRRMHCVGCPISPFHNLLDAAEEHGLEYRELVAAVEEQADLLQQPGP